MVYDGNVHLNWWFGGTPISGNLHMIIFKHWWFSRFSRVKSPYGRAFGAFGSFGHWMQSAKVSQVLHLVVQSLGTCLTIKICSYIFYDFLNSFHDWYSWFIDFLVINGLVGQFAGQPHDLHGKIFGFRVRSFPWTDPFFWNRQHQIIEKWDA